MAEQYALDTDFTDGSKGRIQGLSRSELIEAVASTLEALPFDRIEIVRYEPKDG